jgi:hypothetical protein
MEMSQSIITSLFLLLHLLIQTETAANKSHIPGHRLPFGSGSIKPKGVTVIGRFSSPSVFYSHFVNKKAPIHMKSALTEAKHHGLTEWTDDYFR